MARVEGLAAFPDRICRPSERLPIPAPAAAATFPRVAPVLRIPFVSWWLWVRPEIRRCERPMTSVYAIGSPGRFALPRNAGKVVEPGPGERG
jgi:hypothetical protein